MTLYATTEITESDTIVSHPSGNCPFYLVKESGEGRVEVPDTAVFYADYDLSEEDDEARHME
jgi:hypothetical protein